MIAFLKRRWILLSCAVVLLACSMFDLTLIMRGNHDNGYYALRVHGLYRGGFRVYQSEASGSITWTGNTLRADIHSPELFPIHMELVKGQESDFTIPLWLPLSAVLGWLVIRELRWREKRAKELGSIE